MTLLPDNVSYGKVTGRIHWVMPDTPDTDSYPNADPSIGTVTFTARPGYLLDGAADPPTMLVPIPLVATLDTNGDLVDAQGNQGIYLIATTDPDLNPIGWTYTGKIELAGNPDPFTREFTFELPADSTVDITTLVEIPSDLGTPIAQGPPGSPGISPEEIEDLDNRVDTIEEQIDAMLALILNLGSTTTYSYEDPGKKNGDPVVAGQYGVLAKTGPPVYSTAAGLHTADDTQPALGIDGSAAGSTMMYRVSNPSGEAGSVYINCQNRPLNPTGIFELRSVVPAMMVRLTMLNSGKISWRDATDTEKAKTTWQAVAGEWWRLAWLISLGVYGPQIEFRIYTGNNLETSSPSEVWSYPLLDTPGRYAIGNAGGLPNGIRQFWDTFSIRGDSTMWIPPAAPVEGRPSYVYGQAWPGVNTSTELAVAFLYQPGDAGLAACAAWSTSPAMTAPSFTQPNTLDEFGIAKHSIPGLTPATTYYLQPATATSHVLFGEILKVKTLPAPATPWSMKIHVGSCMSNATAYAEACNVDISAWGPDAHALLGDDGYWGGSMSGDDPPSRDIGKYRNLYQKFPEKRRADQSALILARCISDHELCDNGDTNGPDNPIKTGGAYNMPQSIRQLVAWQALNPCVHWGDVRDPRRHRGYSYDIGSKLRVIVTDFRTPDRSLVLEPDSPTKTMYGQAQLDWLFSRFDNRKMHLIFQETAWTADQIFVANDAGDKPWHYPTEHSKISARIEGTDGYQAGGYRVAMFGGDRHLVGYCSAADNRFGHFPVYIGSGWEKNGLPMVPGETYTWKFGNQPPVRTVMGYMQIVLSYDGADTFTIDATARVADTLSATTPTLFYTPPGMTVRDTFVVPSAPLALDPNEAPTPRVKGSTPRP